MSLIPIIGAAARRRAVAPFDPLTLPGLHAWLDADDTSTTWQDTSATTAATADSDPVGRINDKSGNGNHYSIANTALRPALRTAANGQNGRSVLEFNGSSHILVDPDSTNDFADVGYAYIFAAIRDSNPTGGNSNHLPVHVVRDQVSTTRFALSTRDSGNNRFSGIVRTGTGALSRITSSSDSAFHVMAYITAQADGNHFLRQDGSQVATGAFTAANFANVASFNRAIGGLPNADETAGVTNFFFPGVIAEVLIGTAQLTEAQRNACEAYLLAKWSS